MSTKVKSQRNTEFSASLFVADDVRLEQGGKVTLVGMYADRVVVATVPENASLPTPEMPYAIGGLSFLVNIKGALGKTEILVDLSSAVLHAKEPRKMEIDIPAEGASTNLVLRAEPFTFDTFGVKTVAVEIAGRRHEFQFEIRRGGSPEPEKSSPKRKTTGSPRPRTKAARGSSE